jgi:probable rRNA maturation factor
MVKPKKAKIHFFSHDIRPQLKNITYLKKFIESVFLRERKKLESVNYVFCSDKSILEINKKYLNHDFYTDVITFNLSSNHETIYAEVYISLERVKDNAKKIGVSIKSELHRVIFHAALHLCGYNDKTKIEIQIMRSKEGFLLSRYFSD